jgi:hypothetical protein
LSIWTLSTYPQVVRAGCASYGVGTALGPKACLTRGYGLTILVADLYEQKQVHTPLGTRKFPVYAPISAGDSERFCSCISGSSKHAVGTLLSERERLVLSISNRPITEKLKSKQDQGKSGHSDSRC